MNETCTWCGAEIEPDDGFRAYEPAGERRAAFCRLEHLIPWSIQGAHWEPGEISEPAALDEGATRCSHCGEQLSDAHVLLVRHRGEHRVPDAFCSVDHLTEWGERGRALAVTSPQLAGIPFAGPLDRASQACRVPAT